MQSAIQVFLQHGHTAYHTKGIQGDKRYRIEFMENMVESFELPVNTYYGAFTIEDTLNIKWAGRLR
jgi:hypothetical protein